MKHKILYLLLSLIGLSAYSQESLDQTLKKHNKNKVPYISATELKMFQEQGNTVILDSREQKEFNISHISSAAFIGYDHFSIEEISEIVKSKDSPIVVYCTLGIRSEVIADKLIKAGYNNVKNLYGGICEWKNKDYTVVDPSGNVTENVHVFSKEWSKWLKNGTAVYE